MTVELLCLARCRKKSGVSDFKISEASHMYMYIIGESRRGGGGDIEAASPLLNFKKSKKCYNEKRQKHKKMK